MQKKKEPKCRILLYNVTDGIANEVRLVKTGKPLLITYKEFDELMSLYRSVKGLNTKT